ncbi:hypothetical protein [Aquimarina agarivorans]|uniref:hypothetical protein n=1 Tax=Aquimarina agarivorans TaxID=980584 RepID=UPI001EE66765|nr:hypothetical protein [Aquimarina agarivorans]
MRLLHIILSVFICFSCRGQESRQNNTTQKDTTMTTEKFDIATFEKNKINTEYNFVLDDGTKVRQVEGENDYSVYEYPAPPELFMTFKRFYKSNKSLEQHVIRFPNRFLKKRLEYDKEGKLVEAVDYDKPFKFSFEQLLELIKKEKDTIDLFDKNTTIGRGSDEKGTDWYITYKKVPMRREVIKVDGITGEILERSHYSHLDN